MSDNKCTSCKGTGKYTWISDAGGRVTPGQTTDCPMCNGYGYDTEHKDYPTCPHCGYEQQDDYYDVSDGDWECPKCEKTCEVEVEHRMEFTTRPKE